MGKKILAIRELPRRWTLKGLMILCVWAACRAPAALAATGMPATTQYDPISIMDGGGPFSRGMMLAILGVFAVSVLAVIAVITRKRKGS